MKAISVPLQDIVTTLALISKSHLAIADIIASETINDPQDREPFGSLLTLLARLERGVVDTLIANQDRL